MIRRVVAIMLALAIAALSVAASPASAAPPTLGPVSATDVQGVSAVLKGSVNPQGLPTTYRFEYATERQLRRSGKHGRHVSWVGFNRTIGPRLRRRPRPEHDLLLPPRRDELLGHDHRRDRELRNHGRLRPSPRRRRILGGGLGGRRRTGDRIGHPSI